MGVKMKDRFKRKEEIAIRNKLLIAKRDLIKEAEERKYLFMKEQEARQLLWFQLLAHHQLASLGLEVLRDDRKHAEKRTRLTRARRVIVRFMNAAAFTRGVTRHVHAINVIRRSARRWSIHRIVKKKMAAAGLILGFFSAVGSGQLIRVKLIAFKKSVCIIQNWWRKVRVVIIARTILVTKHFETYENHMRAQLFQQREELEMQLIEQHKRPYAWPEGTRITNAELPEMPPKINEELRRNMLSRSIRTRIIKFAAEMTDYKEWVVDSWYNSRAAAGVHVRGARKSYKEVLKIQATSAATGELQRSLSQVMTKPVLLYLSTQEELASMYARAIETETTNRRQRQDKLQDKNRAFGEERDYQKFMWSSRDCAKSAEAKAERAHEEKNRPPPTKSVAKAVAKPAWKPNSLKSKSIKPRVKKSPRSYYKEFGTFFGRDDQ